MELREWLIILGLALVTIIVIDGVRRLQRQRRVPRLDQVDSTSTDADPVAYTDPEQEARDAEVRSELPNGGARVVRPAAYEPRSKPKLERQEHPGPSRVLSSWRQTQEARPQESRTGDTLGQGRSQVGDASGTETSGRAAPHRQEPRPQEPRYQDTAPLQEDVPQAPRADADQKANQPQAKQPVMGEPSEIDDAAHARMDLEPEDAVATEHQDEMLSGIAADPADHEGYHHDEERYQLVDFDGMSDSLRDRSARVGDSMQRFGSSIQKKMASRKEKRKKDKLERERQKAERQARETSRRQQEQAEREQEARRAAEAAAQRDGDDPLFSPRLSAQKSAQASAEASDRARLDDRRHPEPEESGDERYAAFDASYYADEAAGLSDGGESQHPTLQRALRNGVKVEHARETLSGAEEIIVISVMSRDEEGFSGTALLDLMLACGLRYCRDMQIFHRFETQDPHSELQFSMVNVIKPGTFPVAEGVDFTTPGISLLMPLPGAHDSSAAFEAMVETAMVVVRHLGGELKDENQSVMTAQTVGFARERVQEFERRHRLHRTQAN